MVATNNLADGDVPMIDAHQHFWKFDPVRDSWIDNSMKVIQRNFLPADLQPVLKQYGFSGCVAVQADQSELENHFLLQNAAENEFIKGVVGWVDLQSPKVEERLAYYSQQPKMKGFRHILQGEPQRDLMLQPAFKKGIQLLQQYNFTYDILIYPDQLGYAAELVKLFSNQAFVIDHIAKPNIKKQAIDDWAKQIKAVAQYENVYCKVSGMVTEADWKHWKPEDFTPYLNVVVEAFGMNRLMYGSDWPVCLVAESYGKMLGIVQNYFSSLSEDERARFFGLNAARFYNL